MLDAALQFMLEYKHALLLGGLASAALLLVGLLLIPFTIIRLPADYFSATYRRNAQDRPGRWPWLSAFARNALGVALVLLGIIMLVTPGQGVLTVLIGLVLLDFPGKKRLERKLLSIPTVLTFANTLRRRAGKAPLRL